MLTCTCGCTSRRLTTLTDLQLTTTVEKEPIESTEHADLLLANQTLADMGLYEQPQLRDWVGDSHRCDSYIHVVTSCFGNSRTLVGGAADTVIPSVPPRVQ